MATELATAYISLIPELKGAGKSIASQLGGVDVAPTGRKLGKSLSDGISSGIDSSGIRQLENAVANASQKVGRAMASEKDATNQLKIAQQRLVEVRSKYAEGSSRVMAAEAKVESAQRKAASASERTKSAQVELKRAQEQLSSANKKVSSSSADASRGIASMGKTAGSIKGTLSRLAKVAGPALAAIGFSQLVGEAAAATDATKKFKSTLEFAGKADEVERLTASTRKYADETVYDLSDIQNITAQLAANSVKDYDKLAEAAGNLNAVAGGNAETFSSVGMVLTQTAGAGKLTTENWNQLADAIPGASGKLQEAMLKNGAYTGNFRDAMEKGEISAEEFNQAILDLGFDEAAVKAAKSTATFEGAFGNLRAAAVGGISDVMAKLQPTITGVVNGLVPVVEGAFSTIVTGAGFVADNIGLIAPAVASVTAAFAAFKAANFVSALMTQLGSLSNVMSIVKTSASGLFATLAANPVALVVAAIAALCAGLVVAFNTNEQFRANVLAAWDGIKAAAAEVWPAIQQAVTSACEAMGNVVNAVWPVIQGVITTAMNVVKAAIGTVLAAIKGDWEGAWNGIKAVGQTVWEAIKSIVTAGINAAKGVISSVLDSIKSTWDSCWNGIKSLFSQIWDGIKGAAKTGVDNVYKTVTGIKDKITGFFSDAGKWLVSAGESIMNGLKRGIESAFENVKNFVGGIGDWIVSHKGPPSYDAVMLVKNGELIMGGLLDGMTRGWGDVEDFVKSRNASIQASYDVGAGGSAAYGRGTTNIYIDGAAVNASPALSQAMGLLFDALNREYDMGVC